MKIRLLPVVVPLALSVLAGACAPLHVMNNYFDPAEYEPYQRPGTGVLTGQAFLRQKGGGVVTCAGEPVVLAPSTMYVSEANRAALAGKRLDPVTFQNLKSMDSVKRRTVCDAQGKFTFRDLPQGPWLLATNVTWKVGYSTQGGTMLRTITVSEAPSEIILSDADVVHSPLF